MALARFIINVLTVGATLLALGSLVEVVASLQKKAAHDTSVGIISIEKWNRSLTNDHVHKKLRHLNERRNDEL